MPIESYEDVVLVTGGRDFVDRRCISYVLSKLPRTSVILHGGCRGADELADLVARQRDLRTIRCPAHWSHNDRNYVEVFGPCPVDCRQVVGRPAGMIRNRWMYDTYKEHIRVVLAFHDNLADSKGTKAMVAYAQKQGSRVLTFTGKEVFV